MIILDVIQGSKSWFDARVGKVSASCFSKIITSTGKKSTQYKGYMNGLIAEIAMGRKIETHQSEAMKRGTELEEEARQAYEFITSEEVKEVGMVFKNEDRFISCSPDGLMDKKGLEIKCPNPGTHIKYLLENRLPVDYVPQVQGSMLVTGLDKWDFMSYHPELEQFLIEVKRDDEFCKSLDKYLDEFVAEMNEKLLKLNIKR